MTVKKFWANAGGFCIRSIKIIGAKGLISISHFFGCGLNATVSIKQNLKSLENILLPEPVAQRCSVKKVFLKTSQNSQEDTCVGVPFLIKFQAPQALNFIKKETPAQLFFCEFCEILKNTFFTEPLRWLLLHYQDSLIKQGIQKALSVPQKGLTKINRALRSRQLAIRYNI